MQDKKEETSPPIELIKDRFATELKAEGLPDAGKATQDFFSNYETVSSVEKLAGGIRMGIGAFRAIFNRIAQGIADLGYGFGDIMGGYFRKAEADAIGTAAQNANKDSIDKAADELESKTIWTSALPVLGALGLTLVNPAAGITVGAVSILRGVLRYIKGNVVARQLKALAQSHGEAELNEKSRSSGAVTNSWLRKIPLLFTRGEQVVEGASSVIQLVAAVASLGTPLSALLLVLGSGWSAWKALRALPAPAKFYTALERLFSKELDKAQNKDSTKTESSKDKKIVEVKNDVAKEKKEPTPEKIKQEEKKDEGVKPTKDRQPPIIAQQPQPERKPAVDPKSDTGPRPAPVVGPKGEKIAPPKPSAARSSRRAFITQQPKDDALPEYDPEQTRYRRKKRVGEIFEGSDYDYSQGEGDYYDDDDKEEQVGYYDSPNQMIHPLNRQVKQPRKAASSKTRVERY